MTPGFGCVVTTTGSRPEDLDLALDSLLRQEGVDVQAVVVGNPWEPTGLPPGVRGVALPRAVGIPAGRNAGVPHVEGELLFFLDDDASLAEPDALTRVARLFEEDPKLGLLQLRVDPRDGGRPLREWVPRLRPGDPSRSGDVTAVWEGAVAMPRRVFEEVGGWTDELVYVHEGVDLAWRVMDAGYRVHYAGDVAALHPTPPPGTRLARHGYSLYHGARNRVWLARRYLPLPLAAMYVASFALRTVPRLMRSPDWKEAVRGYRDGMRLPCGGRHRLRARTLWRMTRAGRPPIV